MTAGVVYYTDSRLREPLASTARRLIAASQLPVVSCSLDRPLDFGTNVVVTGTPGYPTMVAQMLAALEASTADVVFFCEHDVLYPREHFDFQPDRDDTYYYNEHVWRWALDRGYAFTYDGLRSLSGMCCDRRLALAHYRARRAAIEAAPPGTWASREPALARKWGYEPGTKPRRRGGFSNEPFASWRSSVPLVDVRHLQTYSPQKIRLKDFTHPPTGWTQIPYREIPGWDLDALFAESRVA